MGEPKLDRCRILVVEDEYLLADELALGLADEGATVLGPVPTIDRAVALFDASTRVDGAVLDLNLGGEPAFPLADMLIARGVPLVFTTGYDASVVPVRFAHVPRCEKPISIGRLTTALNRAIHA